MMFGKLGAGFSRLGSIVRSAVAATITYLNAGGTAYQTDTTVLDASGTSYNVGVNFLDAGGTTYNVGD